MQQIAIYLKGERDYRKIEGSTGPLVYPGAHVWIYKQLYTVTEGGENIQLAQYLFALVYLVTLAVVFQCYRKAKVCVEYGRVKEYADEKKKKIKGSAVCLPVACSFQANA